MKNTAAYWIIGGLIAGALLVGQGYMAHVDHREKAAEQEIFRQGFNVGIDYGANLTVMHLRAGEKGINVKQLQAEGWKLVEQKGLQKVGAQ